MQFDIREIKDFDGFEDILQLQDDIWQLSDRDKISTITLKSLIMEYPLMGLVIGGYHKNIPAGFIICIPTREPSTLFGLIMGVHPQYQGTNLSMRLCMKLYEFAVNRGIEKICWTFEPLDGNLANLYINRIGAIAVKYEINYYQVSDELNKGLPLDRFIVDCNLKSSRVKERLANPNSTIRTEVLNTIYPIANEGNKPDEHQVLLQIPSNIHTLKKTDIEKALEERIKTRQLFNYYLNDKGYFISNFFTEKHQGVRQNCYLLEKRGYI